MGNLRFVTAASLFDGHDVSINIMRRILQQHGVEVIHLGHNRSVQDVVDAALEEDAHGVAVSSYQGGHNEYFEYLRSLAHERGLTHLKIFGGGGGVITPKEIQELEKKGIERIYSPADGMELGLEGIIQDMIKRSEGSTLRGVDVEAFAGRSLGHLEIAKVISYIEEEGKLPFVPSEKAIPVLGITGTGGAGKSSLIDELLARFHNYDPQFKVALVSVDPTKKKTQGALLGDRIRLGHAGHPQFFVRSLATRNSKTELSPEIEKVIAFLRSQDFQLILVETSGIGQASDAITEVSDKCLYVMTPEYGAPSQLEKIEMLDSADFVVINKAEKRDADDAYRDVCKQYRRNRKLFDEVETPNDSLPVVKTKASKFNDPGVNRLFSLILKALGLKATSDRDGSLSPPADNFQIIAPNRSLYLREISACVADYNLQTSALLKKLKQYEALAIVSELGGLGAELGSKKKEMESELSDVLKDLAEFDKIFEQYETGEYRYLIRDREILEKTKYRSLSQLEISKVSLPRFESLIDKYAFIRKQNLPGRFPFSAGIFPFKKVGEDPKRMFAGEGGPKRTNQRFHLLSKNDPAKRLSTAFDSVTLYGEDPDHRPDIFGKIGEAGVSIATLDDMDDLFSGFDLADPKTSVSMTINGPAPIILAMYLNTVLNQNLKGSDLSNESKKMELLRKVRGTVQADILKEDQAQNTCIFNLEFALKLMGDVQEYFSQNKIRNYYTVSVSGYHIAEAGANPITQLAFTMANGFTLVEYYLNRGLSIDDFISNFSFFFSNGLDPEYTVLGSVARRVWAIVMRDKYGATERSQKFKYHIQTSGRSLHAQEIDFNDIRTTLQAFLALSDNCNSLHTNAYDEAVTTPTEESVRRAMAIQMIINKEFGLNKTLNPLQGSYLFNELSDLVEEALLREFERISDKGGVLGAMENMYQRSKIQEESHYYEGLKDSGELPIIGVNTYLADDLSEKMNEEIALTRASDEEKNEQIKRLKNFQKKYDGESEKALLKLQQVAREGGNVFRELMGTVRVCSLGQITRALYEVGGRYRRNV